MFKTHLEPWPMWLGWLKHCPLNPKVTGAIAGQGTSLGCRFSPQMGHVQEATDGCFSPSLCPSLPLSLKSVSMSLGEDKKKTHLDKAKRERPHASNEAICRCGGWLLPQRPGDVHLRTMSRCDPPSTFLTPAGKRQALHEQSRIRG